LKRAFVSYSRLDWNYASRVSSAARSLGWSTFVDEENIPPGSPWREEIRAALISSDLFVLVLTPRWADSQWAQMELDVYGEMKGPKVGHSVISLEFEMVLGSKHMNPILYNTQVVKDASKLTDAELRWVLRCGGESKALGSRQQWAANGLRLERADDEAFRPDPERPTLSPAELLRLEDELSSRIQSELRIRKIVQSVFGQSIPGLSSAPRTAWYQIIKKAMDLGLIERLCEKSRRGTDAEGVPQPPAESEKAPHQFDEEGDGEGDLDH